MVLLDEHLYLLYLYFILLKGCQCPLIICQVALSYCRGCPVNIPRGSFSAIALTNLNWNITNRQILVFKTIRCPSPNYVLSIHAQTISIS